MPSPDSRDDGATHGRLCVFFDQAENNVFQIVAEKRKALILAPLPASGMRLAFFK
jgi:hypothetical protein